MNFLDSTLELSWGSLAVRSWGAKENDTLLAFHGWLDNLASFDALAPYLASKYHVIAVDLAGHGLSDPRPPGTGYYFLDYLRDIYEIISGLPKKKIHLLGHSLGAAITSLMCGIASDRVASCLLIEGLGPYSAPEEEIFEKTKAYLQKMDEISKKKLPVYPSVDEALKARLKVMPSEASQPNFIEGIRAIVSRGLKKTQDGYTWRTDPRLKCPTAHRMTENQVSVFLEKISCPTLLILGNAGMRFQTMSLRQEKIKHLKVVTLEGGHYVHIDEPKKTATLLLDFLASLIS